MNSKTRGMKYFFLSLVMILCVLGYIYAEKPHLLDGVLSGVQTAQQAAAAKVAVNSAPHDSSNGTSNSAPTPGSSGASPAPSNGAATPSDTNNDTPAAPVVIGPTSTNPSGTEVITPDTILPDTGHVRAVLQPGNESLATAGPSPSNDSSGGPKVYVAPDPLPAQANWKWTLTQGVYRNVKVLKADADSVSISYDGGEGIFELSDLPSDIQNLLNYDPDLAAASQQAKAKIEVEKERQIAAALELKKRQLAAAEAAAAQRKMDEESALKAKAALDQAKLALPSYQDDLNFVIKHVSFNPTTGEIHGDPYFLKKYTDDTLEIAQCRQIIATEGK
jgi:hypothetical protein